MIKKLLIAGLLVLLSALPSSAQTIRAVQFNNQNSYIWNNGNLGGPVTAGTGYVEYWYKAFVQATGMISQNVQTINGVPYEMFSVSHVWDPISNGMRLRLYMADTGVNFMTCQTGGFIPTDNNWHHIGVLAFPAAGNCRAEQDGVEKIFPVVDSSGTSFLVPIAGATWTGGAAFLNGTTTEFYQGGMEQLYGVFGDSSLYSALSPVLLEASGVILRGGQGYGPVPLGPNCYGLLGDTIPPLFCLQAKGASASAFTYNFGGLTSFGGGQGLTIPANDPWRYLVP